ncbi:hypothetical protein H072_8445 [Dactylellina haptotyla CBS 200.50]|uniref:Uncharacterized protein n=1 Tax=Dactylellina haptotyla (strain CBS 200.50) TaxID=1284197 RepID=S8BF80_DACHA|nr:hypothetical protein H072_8445 [Dactylellina haptotyla CBS 200.50]
MHYILHHQRYDQTPQPTNQFALAAARAIVPSRSQTPTLSAAAAAAALHAGPKQVTSPGALVTRRMERRGSVTSITSAPVVGRHGSDASMTERIGWLRGSDDGGSRPGSRARPMSRDAVSPTRRGMSSPTRPVKRVVTTERSPPPVARPTMTLGQLESKHMPRVPVKKSVPKSGTKAPVKSAMKKREVPEPEPPVVVSSPLAKKVVAKTKKVAARPKTAPATESQPYIPPALVAAAAAAAPAAKKQQVKAKPKPKPKPVEPVYSSEPEEEEELLPPPRVQEQDSESEPEAPVVRQSQPSGFALKKSLRATPQEAAARAPVKKKAIQTHSDTQGGMLSRGTMRAAVREDMVPVIEDVKTRQLKPKQPKQPKQPKAVSELYESAHAPKPVEKPASGPSDAVKALALQIMREQQAKNAGKPVLLPSRRAQKRQEEEAAALALEEPDTLDDEDAFAAEQEEQEEEELEEEQQVEEEAVEHHQEVTEDQLYERQQFAASASSVTSYMSDLESIPEEAGHSHSSPRDGKKKKKKRPVPESVIIPGKDGIPALPQSPILEFAKQRKSNVVSPEPPATKEHPSAKTMERRRTLERLTSESPTTQTPVVDITAAKEVVVDDAKGSPPSSATLTEDVVQSVVIQTIPPTPPAIEAEKLSPPPRLFSHESSSEDEYATPQKTNGSAKKLKAQSPSPPTGRHSPRLMKRHSPPPRSVSPAKSALKHVHHEGSDRSSILSAEDSSSGGQAGKRKHVRVSFSEDPSVVEMDDDSYHYKPIHSALDKAAEKKGTGKGISGVSFSSFSRMRAERTPSPQPEPLEHSTDSRLAGLLGTDLLGKLGLGKGNKKSHDPLAPDVISASPPPSISDEELESDIDEEKKKVVVVPATPSPPPQTARVPEAIIPEEPVVVLEEPRAAQIAAGHTPPAVEVKPIYPPPATSDLTGNTATISENISHGRPAAFKDDSDEAEEHFSDAYEDLDHVVLSATGSGAVIGVTTAHTAQPEIHPPADNILLPSIAEIVTEQPLEETRLATPPASLVAASGLLPEEAIDDEHEEPHVILAPKPFKPISPRLINTASPPPQTIDTTLTKVEPKVAVPISSSPLASPKTNGVTKPTKTKKAAKVKSELAESKHAPTKTTKQPAEATPPVKAAAAKAAKATKATKATKTKAAPTTGGKLKKRGSANTPAPAPAPAPLAVDSDDSESSFQRENPHRRAARRTGGGFSMRMSMRDASGRVPPSSISPPESGLSGSKWADSSPTSPRFESGFRMGRTIGTGGPRRREYSPDSSDDDTRRTTLRNTQKNEKKGRFLGKATLRTSSAASGRPASSFSQKGSSGFGAGFKSRFADSSDEEDMVSPLPTSNTYQPLTPEYSDDEEVHVNGGAAAAAAASKKIKENGLAESRYAPGEPAAGNYDFTTTISADTDTPKKKWWSFGSKRRGSTSRPVSRAESLQVQPVTLRPTVGDRRISDPDGLGSASNSPSSPMGPQRMKKFRRLSSGSVNSVGSARTWTPSLGTSTLVGSPTNGNTAGRTLTHGRLEGLQEEDEEGLDLHQLQPQQINGVEATDGKAQVAAPNGDIYGVTKPVKKKKFPKLRKMFGLDD